MTAKIVLPVIFMALLPGAASAQMFQPSLYLGPQISLDAHAATPSARSGPSTDATAPQAPAPAPVEPAATTYRPDLTRRRDNYARFVARTRATDPSGAKDLAATFAQHDVVDEIGQLVAPHGLRIDNVADAYALYWITAYEASKGRNPAPSAAKLAAVRGQAARALAATAGFRVAGDAAKQEMAEALWVQAAMLDVGIEQAIGKPDQLKAIGKAAAQGARAMGLDFGRMTLTETGFQLF